jgi:GntR family transcriptional regulator
MRQVYNLQKFSGMNVQLDFRSGQPIYVQLVGQVQQMIANGQLKPGDQLPTVRQLATDLRVNFNTVARAYRLLDEAGLISTQHGRGTYVWEVPGEEAAGKLRREGLQALVGRYLGEAERLGYSAEEAAEIFEEQISAWKERKRGLNEK